MAGCTMRGTCGVTISENHAEWAVTSIRPYCSDAVEREIGELKAGLLANARAWLILAAVASLAACTARHGEPAGRRAADTSFAAMQARGRMVMGVDQYTSTHVFEDLPDGGRIVLERDDPTDSAGIAAIRAHMHGIAAAFRAGDFSQPFRVHAQVVSGTDVMAAHAAAIDYRVVDRPRGAEVRIVTQDPTALAAIHEFLAFQRGAHHAAGHEQMH